MRTTAPILAVIFVLYFMRAANASANGTPVTFKNGADGSLNFNQSSPSPPQANWPFGQFSLAAQDPGSSLTSVTVTLSGTYSGLSGVNPFRLYRNTSNDFSGASAIGSDVAASGSTVTFSSLSDPLPTTTRYYWVTVDLGSSASGTIKGNIGSSGSLAFSLGWASGSSSYGDLNAGSDVGLPVTLSYFAAEQVNNAVVLQWITQSEVDNLGFYVYRALEEGGIYRRITNDLIPGAGNSSTEQTYAFTDANVVSGGTYWYKLEEVAFDGSVEMHGPISVRVEANSQIAPDCFALLPNVPNPFNPITTIAYDLPKASDVTLTIYSITGQQITTLVSTHQTAGYYRVAWNGAGFANGIYVYRLQAGQFEESRRMLLLK